MSPPLALSRFRRAIAGCAALAALTAAAPAVAWTRHDPGCGDATGIACPVVDDDGPSYLPHVSGDGRYVSFWSGHDMAHDGPTGVFRFDRTTGLTVRADIDDRGRRNERSTLESGISADGDRVLYAAMPTDSPVGTSNWQLYVHEFSTGRTVLASANRAGQPSTGWLSPWAQISSDGRFVAFLAEGDDLVKGDRPAQTAETEVYLRDLTLGTTKRVSVGPGGLKEITAASGEPPVVTPGGRYVAFSAAVNLTADDTHYGDDAYVQDMTTGQTELVSLDPAGTPIGGFILGVSDDGTRVLFVGQDAIGPGAAVYLRDRITHTTRRLCALDATGPLFGQRVALSGDGEVAAVETSAPVGHDDHDGRDDIVLIDTRTGAVRATTPDGMVDSPDAQMVDPSLSFDGSVLVVDTAWHHTADPTPNSNGDLNHSEIFGFDARVGAWEQITPDRHPVGSASPGPILPVDPIPAPGPATPAPPAPPSNPATPSSPATTARAKADASGYWMVGDAGEVYGFGAAGRYGNGGAGTVDIEPTPKMDGYWILDRTGHVTPRGGAPALGDATLRAGEHATSLSATRSGRGYWVFTDTGRVVTIGDAPFYGDMSKVRLNGPVLDSVATSSGRGYWMVAGDGGIFSFGDAAFSGSMGGKKLNAAVRSLVPDSDGHGYWLVASDGGIFAFDAAFHGSMGGQKLNKPVSGMVRYGDGYLMVGSDGGIFNFSSAAFVGSLGDKPPAAPVVAVAALP